jgi:hypothetical protein
MQFRSPAHDGEVSAELERRTAQLRVASLEASELALNLLSVDGISSPKINVPQAELSSVHISLKDGFPLWEGIPTVYEMNGSKDRTP